MSFTVIRRVTKWGLRGVRVGEASNPGPASKRRRTQRLRALQRSIDGDSEDDRPLVSASGPKVFAMSDREDSMEDDPTTLHSCWWKAVGVAPTVVWRHPAIRVRQFRGQPDVRCPAVSHNRFAPLDGQEAADVADHPSQWRSLTQRVL